MPLSVLLCCRRLALQATLLHNRKMESSGTSVTQTTRVLLCNHQLCLWSVFADLAGVEFASQYLLTEHKNMNSFKEYVERHSD